MKVRKGEKDYSLRYVNNLIFIFNYSLPVIVENNEYNQSLLSSYTLGCSTGNGW